MKRAVRHPWNTSRCIQHGLCRLLLLLGLPQMSSKHLKDPEVVTMHFSQLKQKCCDDLDKQPSSRPLETEIQLFQYPMQ